MAEKDLEKDLALVIAGEKTLPELLDMDADRMALVAELAHFYFQEGRYQEARVLFEGLLSMDQHEPYYCHALGAVFQRMGNNELALRYYKHALKLDNTEAEAWANMGEVLILEEQIQEGVECLEKAEAIFRRKNPDSSKRFRVQALLTNYRNRIS